METTAPYIHGEAFCLMAYRCESCGWTEIIWNSRDGVTPFGMGCTRDECEGGMLHINWKHDHRDPAYMLRYGQGFWRDGSPDEAEAIMRSRIEKMRDRYPTTPEQEAELIALARSGEGEANEFRKGWPTFDRCREGPRPESDEICGVNLNPQLAMLKLRTRRDIQRRIDGGGRFG